MNFKCPACESTRLEEVLTAATVVSTITDVHADGEVGYREMPEIRTGDVARYECADCGFIIDDDEGNTINNAVDLYLRLIDMAQQAPEE